MSPVIAELMSGSSPPLEYFSPPSFALLLALYGSGVLIVRELSVIWNKGWVSIIVMGAAYGILEEGVAVKSFFDPNWMDLGGLGIYGRFLGTNWVWATWLTVFHSMISISLPILLFTLVYPGLRGTRILSRRQFQLVCGFLFLDVLVCTTLLNQYVPSLPMYILAIAAVVGLVYYARHIPSTFLAPRTASPSWSPLRFAMLGIALTIGNFFIAGLFVEGTVPFVVPIAMISGLTFYGIIKIHEHIGSANNTRELVGLVTGLMTFLVIFGLAQVQVPGMVVLAIIEVLFLIDLNLWARGRTVLVFHVFRLLHGR